MVGCCCRVAADPDVANQVQWDRSFAIGSLAEASVHELKDYGVVFDFAAHADVLGLAALHQASAFLGIPACCSCSAGKQPPAYHQAQSVLVQACHWSCSQHTSCQYLWQTLLHHLSVVLLPSIAVDRQIW